jgi:hypothetical protein
MKAVKPDLRTRTDRSVSTPHQWWTAVDVFMLLAYSSVVLWTLRFHEKWADEAQAWLLARDLDLHTLWIRELRYEGTPGLWHTVLWIAQHVFHVPYEAMGKIGAVCAIFGAAWLILRSPLPRPLRWLMAFSYFFLYQYAVIARPYVLFALLCFIAAERYRHRECPGAFTLSLVPLALLTAHGSVLAFGLAIAFAIRFIASWRSHSDASRRTFLYSAMGLALLYVSLFAILLPAKNTEIPSASLTLKLVAERTFEGIAGALVDNRWLSLLILALFSAWCFFRRSFNSLAFPVILTITLYDLVGWAHQQGTIFLAIITGLLIAWPTREERQFFNRHEKLAHQLVIVMLAIILGYQAYLAAVIIRNDIRLPYSGAEDAAHFLKPIVDQQKVIYGYQYGMVAINAYYSRNIFGNWHHAYYHHAIGEFEPQNVGPEISAGRPDYVVTTWWEALDPALVQQRQIIPMASLGYSLVHASDGYLLTKTGVSRRQIYFVFKRSE